MVNKEEVKNLANLARIQITEEEVEGLTKELHSILDYIGQIKDAKADEESINPVLKNVMREDVPLNSDDEYTEDILNNAPNREKRYISVKKIL